MVAICAGEMRVAPLGYLLPDRAIARFRLRLQSVGVQKTTIHREANFRKHFKADGESGKAKERMFELSQKTGMAEQRRPKGANPERRRLLIALALLLLALGVVLVKDREFWFGSDEAMDQPTPAELENARKAFSESASVPPPAVVAETGGANGVGTGAATKTPATPATRATTNKDVAPVAVKQSSATKTATPRKEVVVAKPVVTPKLAAAAPVKRAVLPPLKVEVVAADTHHAVASKAAKVDAPQNSKVESDATGLVVTPATNAAEREHLAPQPVELRQTLDASYPLLGQHMSVQGSVVLQAVVGADGIIENMRVLSGPAILSAAAQQAVRQWRFKPVLRNGQAVETKATITVNFSIRVADTPASAS
jgi:TonB family protein